ncbi:hypothetical protein COV82_03100 [Candidatus Peregrinibacteria bacterium CG11_big_fil_rev_8_21_14_0_20_46_8]|nr:MAG: hypothetical protein COV82_03100 [Candidatus Peregrinibacteria bacterium CG11_big_fil_rev_8_21_14_0_20_46_8]
MDHISIIRNQSCPNGCKAAVHINSRARNRLQCAKCKRTWAVHSSEFYFGLRSNHAKVQRAIELINQGRSIRSVAQELNVSPVSVQRWKNRYIKWRAVQACSLVDPD